ncbi:uncharacterized protein LOC116302329 [Actinia tenebrosa]|uniref:Uncharacterized protein LOC116302329 n=1 Tax=Actinia tenebrosa TaxID=6105 RepID=A0A6P8IL26_ACTTE|nr:uncharacterized protein LOC116302329 [Actinia tenebrosa]XP_031567472.1 uncharacterized protein LOC116302329 [Actinia tenebrosa]
MERRRDDAGRQPQFTESQYEIPSWQTPWSKPWYQRTDGSSSENGKPRTFKYNSRGHLVDCNCSICEEDLEKAFSPQSNTNQKTLFDIPKDRRNEIKIQQLEDEENGASGEGSAFTSRPQNSNGSNFGASGINSDAPKRVYMFSDLAEVTQTTTSNGRNSEPRSSSASISGQRDRGPTSNGNSTTTSSSGSNHDSMMEGFGKLTAIQAISAQNSDIQERVRNYRGTSRTQDYRAMKELLEYLLRELNRINSPVEWIATTKAIALEGIQKTLHTLEQKVKEAES